jgi:hypothetical protein
LANALVTAKDKIIIGTQIKSDERGSNKKQGFIFKKRLIRPDQM